MRSPDASGTTEYLGAAAVVVFCPAYLRVIEAPALGWSYRCTHHGLLGVVGLAVFVAWERHTAWPMLPCGLAERQFAAVNAVALSCTRR